MGAALIGGLPAPAVRRAEFAAVRACAREALGGHGFPPGPVLPGPRREPIWSDGVHGGRTHCAGYRAAAVALAADAPSLGIDAEVNRPLSGVVMEYVTSAAERTMPADLARRAPIGRSRDTLPELRHGRRAAMDGLPATVIALPGRPGP